MDPRRRKSVFMKYDRTISRTAFTQHSFLNDFSVLVCEKLRWQCVERMCWPIDFHLLIFYMLMQFVDV